MLSAGPSFYGIAVFLYRDSCPAPRVSRLPIVSLPTGRRDNTFKVVPPRFRAFGAAGRHRRSRAVDDDLRATTRPGRIRIRSSSRRWSGPAARSSPGDLIVEFDRQDQIKNSLDRRAELQDLDQQIAKREAQERAARAHDDSEITLAESAIGRAQLEMGKNELLPKINVEKNKLALEQAEATLKQLKATYELKRRAAEADIRILQIRRDRSANAERQAADNAERMSIHAPIGGMAVVKTTWKGNNMADIQEGEEVRAGVPIVDIVNPNAMRVRARVNQADVNELQVGQAGPRRAGRLSRRCSSTAAWRRFRRSG